MKKILFSLIFSFIFLFSTSSVVFADTLTPLDYDKAVHIGGYNSVYLEGSDYCISQDYSNGSCKVVSKDIEIVNNYYITYVSNSSANALIDIVYRTSSSSYSMITFRYSPSSKSIYTNSLTDGYGVNLNCAVGDVLTLKIKYDSAKNRFMFYINDVYFGYLNGNNRPYFNFRTESDTALLTGSI